MIKITSESFGEKDVTLFTLENEQDMKVQIMTYGATITKIELPDAYGNVDDIVLGFKDLEGYKSPSNPYMGATIGRVCNRIAAATFKLGEETIEITKNHGEHHLHGGETGFDKVNWKLEKQNADGITLSHESPDKHEGFPGKLKVSVTFTLNNTHCLGIKMEAECDSPTVVNMTNHTYFNLAGESSGKEGLYDHIIKIFADKYTETNLDLLPTGVLVPVENTIFDLRENTRLEDRIHKRIPSRLGFDDNFCVNPIEGEGLKPVASVKHGPTGRWLEIFSNQPGVQFYTANSFADTENDPEAEPIKGKSEYKKHAGFCLETQKYPDAPNHANFPSIALQPEEKYTHEVNYQFGVDRAFYICLPNPEGPLRRHGECNVLGVLDCTRKSEGGEKVLETTKFLSIIDNK